MLGQFGITGQAASDYADKLGLVPDNVATAVALSGVATAEQQLDTLTRQRQVRIQAIVDRGADVTPQSGGTTRPGFAEGGAVYGPGTPTSDSIIARLSAGEHVFDAQDVAKLGGQAGVYAFRQALDAGRTPVWPGARVPGFANGGAVGWQPQQYMRSSDFASSAAQGPVDARQSSYSQTIIAPEGVSAYDVARIAADEYNWTMKGDG